jgi:1-acyl-sn-glycerol-3-phosphate acyltransferase/nucleoside-diphosphate-sugar epimerase
MNMARVLVIDRRESIAAHLVRRLSQSPAVEFCQRAPQSDDYAAWLQQHGVDTAVYSPPLQARHQSIPDLADAKIVLQQFAQAGIKKLVLLSSAAVNTPSPHHPGIVCEAVTSVRNGKNPIAHRWLELEALAQKHFDQGSKAQLIILRPAPVPIPGESDYFSRLLSGRLAITLPGHDPTIQLLSPDDLAEAVCRAVETDKGGVYNVAPDGVIPLRAALGRLGLRRTPIPRWTQRMARHGLARLGLADPVEQLEYIRYSWTVSNQRIKRELGFAPRRSSAQVVEELLMSQRVNESTSQLTHLPIDSLTHLPTPVIRDPQSEEFDDFGMDKNYIAAFGRTLFKFLHDYYWRIEVDGLDHIPHEGRGVLVGVHRGFMPWDGVMALHGIVQKLGRYPRFLIHPGLLKFPHLFNYMMKLGGIVACQKNADYVLERDELLGFFPEGIRGAFSLYRDAYRLGKFGRDEFVKMALRNGAPIIPFVTVGSAEIFPILAKIEWRWWKRQTEWPFFPITPTWPLLPLPLPSKWHTQFLPPLHLERQYPPEAANDPAIVQAISQEVRGRMQRAIEDMLQRRKSIFFGSIFKEQVS